MKRTLFVALLCLTLGTAAWAAPIQGTTNPNAFTRDYIDWCQYGCAFGSFPSPQAWVSHGGAAGTLSLNPGFQSFYSPQQGSSWTGNFVNGMGLIYNGLVFGNTPITGIVASFKSGVSGVGAYVQSDILGPFSAMISLFDQHSNFLGSYTANGVSDTKVGTALFIGASGVGPIFAAQFDVIDVNGNEDFAIGQVNVNTIPEPGTLVLFGSGVLGLTGLLQRKLNL
jgi:hypothetical protein